MTSSAHASTIPRPQPGAAQGMKIILNGDDRDVPQGLTVEGLLQHLGINARKVAVERNLEIVPKSAFTTTMLAAGDRLEIVHFIGGG